MGDLSEYKGFSFVRKHTGVCVLVHTQLLHMHVQIGYLEMGTAWVAFA